jgi:hypothetical protein
MPNNKECKVCGNSQIAHINAHDHFFAKNFESREKRLGFIHQEWPGVCQNFVDPDEEITVVEAKKKGSQPYPQE